MGFSSKKGMGYKLLQTYGLWGQIFCPPTWWTKKSMGYVSLWVITGMGYEYDCI
jgi:hypothetical protein